MCVYVCMHASARVSFNFKIQSHTNLTTKVLSESTQQTSSFKACLVCCKWEKNEQVENKDDKYEGVSGILSFV